MSGAAPVYQPGLKPLLARIAESYRRRDDPTTCALLQEAIKLTPYRIDLRFNLAHHHIQTDNPAAALAAFRELADLVPRDVDALTCLAHWQRYFDDMSEAGKTMYRLADSRSTRAADLLRIWQTIDTRQAETISDRLPARIKCRGRPAVVTLGFVLNDDGTMRQPMIDRLEKTLAAAEKFPDAVLVVSGGVPKSGVVEAQVMRQWLLERGVPADRIVQEGYSRDLVENIAYSRQLLDQMDIGAALLVTSANNVRRAAAALEVNARVNGSRVLAPTAVACSGMTFDNFIDDGGDRIKLYRDILRAYGMPMMRTYPELVEL